MFFNDASMILGLIDQYMSNWNNNKTHISSVVMDDVIVDMHKFLPWSCQMMFSTYDDHAVSHSLHMSQRYIYLFH